MILNSYLDNKWEKLENILKWMIRFTYKIYGFIYGLLRRKCAICMYILEKSNAKNQESKHPF